MKHNTAGHTSVFEHQCATGLFNSLNLAHFTPQWLKATAAAQLDTVCNLLNKKRSL